MPHKVWLANDLVINDRQNLVGLARSNCTILSLLRGGIGLPSSPASLSQRLGKWPMVSGITRPGNRLTLTTYHLMSTPALRYAQRRALISELNPERELPFRLTVTDEIPPEGVIAAFGPWDIYEAVSWYCRGLLWLDRDTSKTIADITGAVHIEDGRYDRQKAIVIEEATTNIVGNPSFEVNVTDWWTTTLNGTSTRIITDFLFGDACNKLTADATLNPYIIKGTVVTNPVQDDTYIMTAWFKGVGATIGKDATVNLKESGGAAADVTVTGTIVLTAQWQRVEIVRTIVEADRTALDLWARIFCLEAEYGYVDGIQLEEKAYATSYCDGSLGPGYAWAGTPHNSVSTRTATVFDLDDDANAILALRSKLSIRAVLQCQYGVDDTWPATDAVVWGAYDSVTGYRFDAYYVDVGKGWILRMTGPGGTENIISTAQTFSAGDWIELIFTIDYDNDIGMLYINGLYNAQNVSMTEPPIDLDTWRIGSFAHTSGYQGGFSFAEFTVWDRVLDAAEIVFLASTSGNRPAATAHGRARYVNAITEATRPLVLDGIPTNRGDVSMLSIDREVRWRSMDGDAVFTQAVADTHLWDVEVDSDDDVYPVIHLEPTDAKDAGTGYAYKRFATFIWNVEATYPGYPVTIIWDGATAVGAAKMQADGDDCRVFVDGIEVDRWFETGAGAGQINSASAHVWFLMNFDPKPSAWAKLASGMGAGDTVTYIESSTSIDDYPSSGIIQIHDELFTYTSTNKGLKRFLGVTRAAKTSMAAIHAAATDIEWVQHEVWMYYGDATATAPSQDDRYKPAFDLSTSTNGAWDYDQAASGVFGDDDGLRAGAWVPSVSGGGASPPYYYTGNQDTQVTPWVELGGKTPHPWQSVRWSLYNPCGVANANCQTGEHRADINYTYWKGYIQSSDDGLSWTNEYTIPGPVANGAWAAWGRSENMASKPYCALYLNNVQNITGPFYLECADVIVTLTGATIPGLTVLDEATNYTIDAVITNITTGEAIIVNASIEEDQILEINTYLKTVTYLRDNSNLVSGVLMDDLGRRDWLRLIRGTNAMSFEDTGTNGVKIAIYWHRRDWE